MSDSSMSDPIQMSLTGEGAGVFMYTQVNTTAFYQSSLVLSTMDNSSAYQQFPVNILSQSI